MRVRDSRGRCRAVASGRRERFSRGVDRRQQRAPVKWRRNRTGLGIGGRRGCGCRLGLDLDTVQQRREARRPAIAAAIEAVRALSTPRGRDRCRRPRRGRDAVAARLLPRALGLALLLRSSRTRGGRFGAREKRARRAARRGRRPVVVFVVVSVGAVGLVGEKRAKEHLNGARSASRDPRVRLLVGLRDSRATGGARGDGRAMPLERPRGPRRAPRARGGGSVRALFRSRGAGRGGSCAGNRRRGRAAVVGLAVGDASQRADGRAYGVDSRSPILYLERPLARRRRVSHPGRLAIEGIEDARAARGELRAREATGSLTHASRQKAQARSEARATERAR